MDTVEPLQKPDPEWQCAAIRFLFVALACAGWGALWVFVYRPTLGI